VNLCRLTLNLTYKKGRVKNQTIYYRTDGRHAGIGSNITGPDGAPSLLGYPRVE